MPPLPIVHINGWPGIGKLTIARKIIALLGGSHDARLVHNHLLIDPVDTILSRNSPSYQTYRRNLRAIVFKAIATVPETFDSIYVFTDFQTDNELGKSVTNEYAEVANQRGCAFVPIILSCSLEENRRRITSAGRLDADGRAGKLTDPEHLVAMRGRGEIRQFQDNPHFLNLDVTALDAQAAAQNIVDHLHRVIQGGN